MTIKSNDGREGPARRLPALVELARSISGARDAGLRLAPSAAKAAPALEAAGLECGQEPLEEVEGDSVVSRLDEGDRSLTDEIDIALRLTDRDDRPLGRLELRSASPAALSRRGEAQLVSLADLLSSTLADLTHPSADFVARAAALVEQLQAYDSGVASHVLTGFLRLLGGRAPRPAELTALRLAGLVAAAGPGAELTAEARALLARLAIEPVPAEPARAAGGAPAARRAAAVAPVERRAFARLELADRVYEMGEAGESGPLGFREADGDGAWRNLRNGLADGWTEIAAEIIGLTRDVELEYARTHVIRRRDLPTEEIAEAYELNGRVWWIRDDAEGGDLRCDDGDWRRVALPPRRQEDSGQERALSALFEVMPEARAAVEDEANAWVRRIAAGVRVVPVMSAV